MGHNGGFNPYRDANGEYATPEGAGKPGRSRTRGGASAGKAAPSPRDSIIGGWPVGKRSGAYGTRSRANQVGSVPTPGYRPKGGGVLGRSKLPNNPRSAPGAPRIARSPKLLSPNTQRTNPTPEDQRFSQSFRNDGGGVPVIGYRGKGTNRYGERS